MMLNRMLNYSLSVDRFAIRTYLYTVDVLDIEGKILFGNNFHYRTIHEMKKQVSQATLQFLFFPKREMRLCI